MRISYRIIAIMVVIMMMAAQSILFTVRHTLEGTQLNFEKAPRFSYFKNRIIDHSS